MKNRNLDNSDHWATPPIFYNKLSERFDFDFDPCPFMHDVNEWDGLEVDWGKMNFVNPPYSRAIKEAFVKKDIFESQKGNKSVLLLPVSTSTKLFHDHIKPNAKSIEFVRGRIKFIGINTKGQYVNWDQWDRNPPSGAVEVKNSGMHDSMIVIL